MKMFSLLIAVILSATQTQKVKLPTVKRDLNTVKNYIIKVVGADTIKEIKEREGGQAFLEKFFKDQKWMEQFAGSGIFNPDGWRDAQKNNASTALKALDLLAWNDKPISEGKMWMDTEIGRNACTALALDHGGDFDDEKLVSIAELYRGWDKDGTLHADCYKMDTRQWREVMAFGQNSELSAENVKWSHEFATVPWGKYYGTCWECHYRMVNCFGASVHGSDYYRPWQHAWSTQELRYRVGGVCGGLSKFGSSNAFSHGIRSYTAGQPGHCAFMLWNVDEARWDHAYSVTGHTGQHFRLNSDTHRFPAAEEQDRYYQNPRRMDAEFLRWQGKYKESMLMANNNWQAADEWRATLKGKARNMEWDDFGKTVVQTFSDAPCLGWCLYNSYLDSFGTDKEGMLAAVMKGFKMQEHVGKTPEVMYLDEDILDGIAARFKGNQEAQKKIFRGALAGYLTTPTFLRQSITWGATKFMHNSEEIAWYLDTLEKVALRGKAKLDYRGMIVSASQAGDISTFKQVYSLMDKVSPGEAPKTAGKAFPLKDYGGDLLSQDGMLQISTTSNWDSPIRYRNVLNAEDYAEPNGFHTDNDEAPWAQVKLAGETTVKGVTVVDRSGQNKNRQVPMEILISDDGVAWEKVAGEKSIKDEYKFDIGGKNAKYVRVARAQGAGKMPFHLHKILVYGTKNY